MIDRNGRIGLEQGADVASVHQIGANEAGKGEWAGYCLLGGLCQAQQQKADQSDGDLNSNRVLGGSDKAGDFQGLFDPAEEQLDRPALFVKVGNQPGRGGEIIGRDAQDLATEPVRLHPQCGLLIIGDRRLLTRAAGAEDRGADPHMGGAEADSLLEIGAHAHAEEAEPGASGDLAQQGEMRCGLLVEWRDAH